MTDPASAPRGALDGLREAVNTLKFKVVLVVVGSALVAGLVSTYFVSGQSGKVATRLLLEQQTGEVELVADTLNGRAAQIQYMLRLLASQISPQALRSPAAVEDLLQNRVLTRQAFAMLAVAAPDGRVLARAFNGQPQSLVGEIAANAEFRRTLDSALPQISDPVADHSAARAAVTFTMPVLDPTGAVLAVILGIYQFDPKTLLPGRVRAQRGGQTTLLAYSRDGLIISHPNPARLLGNIRDEPGMQDIHADWVGAGRVVERQGRGLATPDFMVSQAGAALPGWMVAELTSSASALGPLHDVIRSSWLVTLGITAFFALVSVLLILWLTRPMGQLRRRAQQILDGTVAAEEGWPQTDGEIGELVRVFREVTVTRDKALQSQAVMVDQLQAILNNASVGVLFTRAGRFELAGQHLCQILGYEAGELTGQPVRLIYPSDEAYAEIGERVGEAFRGHGRFDGELVFKRKDGSTFWAHIMGRSVLPDDPSGGTIWIVEDITQARAAREHLSWTATHDSLTHLANRREFEARLDHALGHFGGRDVCVMFVDLDRFKSINDSAGHAVGDEVLRQVSRLLEAQVRQSDSVGRLGGDEFAVLLPGCSLPRAQEIAEQMRASVQDWRLVRGDAALSVGASIGIVEVTPALGDLQTVLDAADQACYAAKRAGRNRVVVYGHFADSVIAALA